MQLLSKVSTGGKQGGPEFKVSLGNLSQKKTTIKQKSVWQKISTMTTKFEWKREVSNKFIQKESCLQSSKGTKQTKKWLRDKIYMQV